MLEFLRDWLRGPHEPPVEVADEVIVAAEDGRPLRTRIGRATAPCPACGGEAYPDTPHDHGRMRSSIW